MVCDYAHLECMVVFYLCCTVFLSLYVVASELHMALLLEYRPYCLALMGIVVDRRPLSLLD